MNPNSSSSSSSSSSSNSTASNPDGTQPSQLEKDRSKYASLGRIPSCKLFPKTPCPLLKVCDKEQQAQLASLSSCCLFLEVYCPLLEPFSISLQYRRHCVLHRHLSEKAKPDA